jgi:hypothetical protein
MVGSWLSWRPHLAADKSLQSATIDGLVDHRPKVIVLARKPDDI